SGGKISIVSNELPCEKEGYVRIRTMVKDTGIGMSKEFLPHLFDSFTREHNTTISKVSGTGLGMSIVKALVDLMGGTIEVESELGKGTTFTVTLDHRIADRSYYEKQKAYVDSESTAKLFGTKILMAEDNDLNAEIAEAILTDMGIVVDRVEDGIQCVARIEEVPAGSYDLILMDIQMPNMDGYKATEKIRRFADREKAEIPIIAMTANAFDEDKRKALNMGMNGHVTKPINVNDLLRQLYCILNNRVRNKKD
ncbi:MAG: response regulator, partial [Clostridia bacterium]|nr:response regulator [Clostridia bacterium]